MTREEFEELVAEALDRIPQELTRLMDNVAVFVEDEPPAEDPELLGLYEGTPLTDRGEWYAGVLPDRITIYRGPTLRMCASREDIVAETEVTVPRRPVIAPVQGAGWGRRRDARRSAPAQFVEPCVLNAEVVRHLVDDRHGHLVHHVLRRLAEAQGRAHVDRDAVRKDSGVPLAAFREGVPSYSPSSSGSSAGGSSSTKTATLSMTRVSSGGIWSRASLTSSSNASRVISSTGPLSTTGRVIGGARRPRPSATGERRTGGPLGCHSDGERPGAVRSGQGAPSGVGRAASGRRENLLPSSHFQLTPSRASHRRRGPL